MLAGLDSVAEDAALAEDIGVWRAVLGADEAVGSEAVGFRTSSCTRTWLASVAP
jgi:hypothetical protein